MNTETLEIYINQIIRGMQQYNYTVEEFEFLKGTCIPWGLWKKLNDGTKRTLLFMDLDQDIFNEDYEKYICSKINCNKENLIKVVLVSEHRDNNYVENRINYLRSANALNNNFIIIDLVKLQIQISDQNLEEVQQEIITVVNNNERINNNEKIKHASVTYALIAINIVMFIISAILTKGFFNIFGDNFLSINMDRLISLGAKYNPDIESGQWFRLVTCMFLHGGIIHIATNMFSLYSIGPFIEQLYGKLKYILVYFISGIIASLFSFFFSPYSVSVGASGAIFGLVGVILVFAIKERKRVGKNFLINILVVIGINLFIGLSLPDIDNFAHLGGFLSGVVFGGVASLIEKK